VIVFIPLGANPCGPLPCSTGPVASLHDEPLGSLYPQKSELTLRFQKWLRVLAGGPLGFRFFATPS
jgi:hypothetical protein